MNPTELLMNLMNGTMPEVSPDEAARIQAGFDEADAKREMQLNPKPGQEHNGWKHIKCGRCSGNGQIDGYNHVANGICFRCKGKGVELVRA